MSKIDIVPHPDGVFLNWFDQLAAAATAKGAAAGLPATDISTLTACATELHTRFAAATAAKATADQAVIDKNASRARAEVVARAAIRRLKASTAYNEGLGAQFGVLAADDSTDMTAAKPVLTATAQLGGVVVIDFVKSKSDGVNLYSRRGADAGFTFLARDTASPYVDNRPLLVEGKPELREYKAMYILDDVETGLPSDIASIIAQPV